MGEVLIGSAGWSYKDWAGKVYPDPAPPNAPPNTTVFVKKIEEGSGAFFGDSSLQGQDWSDVINVQSIGTLVPGDTGTPSQIDLTQAQLATIDRKLYPEERIQFRLQSASGSNFMRWVTGNYSATAVEWRPKLGIHYTRPIPTGPAPNTDWKWCAPPN